MAFAKRFVAAVLLVPALVQTVFAQSEPKFIYPAKSDDGNLDFYDNTQVDVAYECSTDTVTLRIYCQDDDKEDYVHQGQFSNPLSRVSID